MTHLQSPHSPLLTTRREFLHRTAGGCGAVALQALLGQEAMAEKSVEERPAGFQQSPHFRPTAKRVIFLSMSGGPSQVDTFDFKPTLQKADGQLLPQSIIPKETRGINLLLQTQRTLLPSPWKWNSYGGSGMWASELMKHTAQHADELCIVKSMQCDSANHAPATYQMNTGVVMEGKPSLGSWVTYGLGQENQNLPGYVLLFNVGGYGGSANWSNAFLPTAHQGTRFRLKGDPVLHLKTPEVFARGERQSQQLLRSLNRQHLKKHPGLLELEGRIASYELAFRMQSEAMNLGDFSDETAHTLNMYGISDAEDSGFGKMCLQARRLVERGVRFVQLYHGIDKDGWDAHQDLVENHERNAKLTDQPIAALLADLKQRGLLDETLVVWAGEFGRTPMKQNDLGRNHNPFGFTIWMAGGGIQGGQSIGATDEFGLQAIQEPYHVRDLHATILVALGLNPEELFFRQNGRPERLTGVAGSAKLIQGALG